MKNPITPEGAASAQNPLPPVPTTKILAIAHFMGTPMTPAQRAQIMPHEVHDTVNAYLAGKIDQWYFRTDGKGVVFIVNAPWPATCCRSVPAAYNAAPAAGVLHKPAA